MRYCFGDVKVEKWLKGFVHPEFVVSLNNQEVEREALLDVERPASLLCSGPSSQNIQSDSGISLAGSGETQCDEEKEKCNQSPSCYDNKNVFSSVVSGGKCNFFLCRMLFCSSGPLLIWMIRCSTAVSNWPDLLQAL